MATTKECKLMYNVQNMLQLMSNTKMSKPVQVSCENVRNNKNPLT